MNKKFFQNSLKKVQQFLKSAVLYMREKILGIVMVQYEGRMMMNKRGCGKFLVVEPVNKSCSNSHKGLKFMCDVKKDDYF